MVLQEELQEFLLVPPLDFVVILHAVGLVRRTVRWRALGEHRPRGGGQHEREQNVFHRPSSGGNHVA